MSSGENILWIVKSWTKRGVSRRVFRTREAARGYYDKQIKKGIEALSPQRATWGPEQ